MSLRSFMDAHRSIGEVETRLYGNRITVAASAIDGRGRVIVHGRTQQGHDIGGALTVDDAKALRDYLDQAIHYAERIATEQASESIPTLERKLADARRRATPMDLRSKPGPAA